MFSPTVGLQRHYIEMYSTFIPLKMVQKTAFVHSHYNFLFKEERLQVVFSLFAFEVPFQYRDKIRDT